ncbi:MAG: glycosyltransferase family 4 protein [Acidobacteriota bacterium]|nr:glycosyltransferase family 4 protein [Acidobacteriota bacterium]
MNILTFTTLWPNAEQPNFGVFVKHRVAALAKLDGVNVRIVAPVPYFPKVGRLLTRAVLNRLPKHWQQMARVPQQEVIDGLPTQHPPYLVTPKLGMSFYGNWMARGAFETVERLHREQPFDLIDAHYVYPDGYAATLLGERLNIPVFITARGTDINLFSRMPLIRPKIVKALNSAAGIVAVSEALKQRMVELGIAAEKIAVIRNGVDREVFFPRDRKEARQRLKLEAEGKILLSVGALVPVKGFDRLIDAMALLKREEQVKKDRSRLKLFVIGEGSERRALESKISNLRLENCVRLLGAKPQAELADWYSAADLFCLASHREGCPNVVIEAMACGLPIVAANVGGVVELLTTEIGNLITEHSAEKFADALKKALAVGWNRNLIAHFGSDRSWNVAADEVHDFFVAQRFF